MNFHQPVTQNVPTIVPAFAIKNNELIQPQKIFTKKQYPNLKEDLVKIMSQDGRNIYVPAHKLYLSSMDF